MKKYSDAQIADIIESEGLEYSMRDYLSPNQIEDETTRQMWIEALVLLLKIEQRVIAARATQEGYYA